MTCVNGRSLAYPFAGITRYLNELIPRLGAIDVLAPPPWIPKRGGHIWEQAVLPLKVGKRLLWNPANTGPVLLRVKRQVSTLHDLALLDPAMNPNTSNYYSWMMPRLAAKSCGIITVSEFSRNEILQRFQCAPDAIQAIPNGLDHRRFKVHDEVQIKESLQKHGISPGYLFTLGSASPRKNLVKMINAWIQAKDHLPKTLNFVVAGDVDPALPINRDPQARVKLLGRVDESHLPALLSAAGAFIFASLYEGFGLPPLEAMACGTPCIVSNSTSLPEVVGDAALMVDPSSEHMLAQSIVDVLNNDSLQMHLRHKGLARAASFTWDKTAAATHEFLSRFDDRLPSALLNLKTT